MLDITHFFASAALAQTAAAPVEAPGGSPSSIGMSFLPLLLIFAVFYLLLIRPQQKKMDEQGKMIKALKRGDRVVTAGGIHGKIVKLDGDDNLVIEIADGVQVKVVRNTVSALVAKPTPASSTGEKSETVDAEAVEDPDKKIESKSKKLLPPS